MITYSFLIPTRRPASLERMLDSIAKTTFDKSRIEILLAIDNDDIASRNKFEELKNKFANVLDISMHLRERSEFLNRDYYNWLATKAKYEMFWVLGDDIIFNVQDWDKITDSTLESYFAKYPDRVVCMSMKDNTPPPSHTLPKFPCFPMFSREARDVLGFILHPRIPTWGADFVVYCIYKNIDRLIEMHDQIYLIHVSFHTKMVPEDAVAIRIGTIFNRLKMIPEYNIDEIIASEVPSLRGTVQNHINDYYTQRQLEHPRK